MSKGNNIFLSTFFPYFNSLLFLSKFYEKDSIRSNQTFFNHSLASKLVFNFSRNSAPTTLPRTPQSSSSRGSILPSPSGANPFYSRPPEYNNLYAGYTPSEGNEDDGEGYVPKTAYQVSLDIL